MRPQGRPSTRARATLVGSALRGTAVAVVLAVLTMSALTVADARQHATAGQPAGFALTGSAAISTAAGPATGSSPRKHRRPAPSPAGHLPADWPRHLPVPAGQIQGSTGSVSQWSVQILTRGSAAAVHRRTMRFYVARGFSRVTDSVLRRGRLRIVVVTENRDHSATRTFLVLGVTRR
jgi:hypothetical protein